METEILTIFNEHQKPIGTATREEVHRLGHWHETFHCWFVARENGQDMLYLQLRSPMKKDYPNLLDITAAGHLLTTESVEDGVREIQEETGIAVAFEDLHSLGIIPYSMRNSDMIDNELAHVYVYHTEHKMNDFHVQPEEVAGIYKVALQDFSKVWSSELENIPCLGFTHSEYGEQLFNEKMISKSDLVPHPDSYYEAVIRGIYENLLKGREICH
ncbi:NUDIX domain-containing protein [Sporosarcina aquimarina]|uniref:NUDIX hydrolase n=1 Tax=Sporosarcina aquimarina TaxID=114975 RepID=UPI00203E889A|nr:NUDIX domain-containing protein [Sporosarcina aquimarina]MCM3758502.1 NUDIX domain-containing protein [Sporosarcina aquimarina]